ncbi:hypothetical protein LSH36_383g02022 [Paralvinella palmiformis]|uniref:Uncharacterized protein n=1 Tax=Paralvinella palmiformis TaxID=53620 RepID=A0AAD9MYW5_9ANNE|nr:hypothetical protein LSH36_383g02022 [Paralvinella palmiformis]
MPVSLVRKSFANDSHQLAHSLTLCRIHEHINKQVFSRRDQLDEARDEGGEVCMCQCAGYRTVSSASWINADSSHQNLRAFPRVPTDDPFRYIYDRSFDL